MYKISEKFLKNESKMHQVGAFLRSGAGFRPFLRRIAVFIVRVQLQTVTNRYTRLVFPSLAEAQQVSSILLSTGRQVLNNFSGVQK